MKSSSDGKIVIVSSTKTELKYSFHQNWRRTTFAGIYKRKRFNINLQLFYGKFVLHFIEPPVLAIRCSDKNIFRAITKDVPEKNDFVEKSLNPIQVQHKVNFLSRFQGTNPENGKALQCDKYVATALGKPVAKQYFGSLISALINLSLNAKLYKFLK